MLLAILGEVWGDAETQPSAQATDIDFSFDDVELDTSAQGEALYETTVVGEPSAEEGLSRVRISRQAIERRGATTAAEVLEHETAVFAQPDGKGERLLRMRGFDQRGVAVYLDSVPFALSWSGATDLGKLPAEMIDSVLLIKGPTSIVHGPGGMGGAVLIQTRDPKESPWLESELESGGDGETRMTMYHGQGIGPIAYGLGVGAMSRGDYRLSSQFEPRQTIEGEPLANGNGYLQNSDRVLRHAALKLEASLGSRHSVAAQGFALDGELGIPRSTSDDRPYFIRFTLWRAATVQLSHEYRGQRLELSTALFGAFFSNRLDAYDDDTYATQQDSNASASLFDDRSLGVRFVSDYRIGGLAAGDGHLRVWLAAERDLHGSRYLFGGQDEETHRFDRSLLSAVPELELPLSRKWSALVALHADLDLAEAEGQSAKPTGTLGPLASLRWDPLDSLMARLWAARRNRIPSLKERFHDQVGFVRANPSLRHEAAWYFGLDLSLSLGKTLRLEASGFDAEVQDLINAEYVPDTNGVMQNRNVAKARFAGTEIAAVFEPVRQLEFRVGYAFLYARRLTNAEGEDRLAQIPTHQASLEAELLPVSWLRLASSFRVVGPQAFDDYTILGLGELGTYAVWDARLEVRPARPVTVWLRGSNLLDMNYQTKYGYPDRGIAGWLGVRLSVD